MGDRSDTEKLQLRHYSKKGSKKNRRWLVIASQPLLAKSARDSFPEASKALNDHHDSFRSGLEAGSVNVTTALDGTIVAICPVSDCVALLGAAWQHLDSRGSVDYQETEWTAKVVAAIGDVVDLCEEEHRVEPHGAAIDEVVRLLRDVAEDGELLITDDVQAELGSENKIKVGRRSLVVCPQELEAKTLIPNGRPTKLGVMRAASDQSKDVVIVFRPGLRSHLAAVDRALLAVQRRFNRVLPAVRGSLRDPTGSSGSETSLAALLEELRDAVEVPEAPVAKLRDAWDAAKTELHADHVLFEGITKVLEAAEECLERVTAMEAMVAQSRAPSPAYSREQQAVDSLVPKLIADPGHALDASADLRNRYEEQFDASF